MKLTTINQKGEPLEGCRSQNYFGLNLFLAIEFFNKTRSNKFQPQRPDPRITLFRMKEQARMREDLIECGGYLGFTIEQIESEWRMLVRQATNKATAEWSMACGHSKKDAVPYNKQSIREVEKAYRKGRAWLNSEISLRSDTHETWLCTPINQMDLKESRLKTRRNVPLKLRYETMKSNRKKNNGDQTCEICKSKEGPWHVDHIIPLSKGGTNEPENLQTLCQDCNLGKGASI